MDIFISVFILAVVREELLLCKPVTRSMAWYWVSSVRSHVGLEARRRVSDSKWLLLNDCH